MAMVALQGGADRVRAVPGPKPRFLSDDEKWALARADLAIAQAEAQHAELVRRFGYSAVARHLQITTEAVRSRAMRRLRRYEELREQLGE